MNRYLYLFCNKSYGLPFLKVFCEFAKVNPDDNYFVVFSMKGANKSTNILKMFKFLIEDSIRTSLFLKLLSHNKVKIMRVSNINDPRFYQSVPKGAIGFVSGFNQIFTKPIIERFSLLINFHPSLLPYYRGAIPSYWVIKNNETITGFTAHYINEKIDAGEIIFQEIVEVNHGISEKDLDRKIAYIGSFYFAECLRNIIHGKELRRRKIDPPYKHKIHYISALRQ